MTIRRTARLLIFCAAVAVPPVAGQVGPPALDQLVSDLDSMDAARRLQATGVLSDSPDLALRDLEPILLRPDLSPEQRTRLLTAAKNRFQSEPRAALGVEFDIELPEEAGVHLRRTIPGFAAADILRAGDRIDYVDGVRLAGREHIRAMIISRDPGDTLSLGVLRNGSLITVEVPLGRFRDLDDPLSGRSGNSMIGAALVRAWAIRSEPYAALEHANTRTIDSGLTPAAWQPDGAPPAGSFDEQRRQPTVVMGGTARGGVDPQQVDLSQNWTPGSGRVNPGANGRQMGLDEILRTRLANSRQQRAQLAQIAGLLRRQVESPNLGPVMRESLKRDLDQYEQAIRALDASITAIQDELMRRR